MLGWGGGCCGGVCAGHPTNQVGLSANRVQKSLLMAGRDTQQQMVPEALWLPMPVLPPPSHPSVPLEVGGKEAATETQAGACVTKMDVFDPIGFAGGCGKC